MFVCVFPSSAIVIFCGFPCRSLPAWLLQTLERSYLLKINGVITERPQHMLMRVSVGIHKHDIAGAIETYHYMSQKFFTHARCVLVPAALASCLRCAVVVQ